MCDINKNDRIKKYAVFVAFCLFHTAEVKPNYVFCFVCSVKVCCFGKKWIESNDLLFVAGVCIHSDQVKQHKIEVKKRYWNRNWSELLKMLQFFLESNSLDRVHWTQVTSWHFRMRQHKFCLFLFTLAKEQSKRISE